MEGCKKLSASWSAGRFFFVWPSWARQTDQHKHWTKSGAGILFKSTSRRPTSTRLNGFLWQLGIFMAPSDSMGFAAEIEGSSEGGTATIHCRCSNTRKGDTNRLFLKFKAFEFLDLISNVSLFWCSAALDYFLLPFDHHVQTSQGKWLCSGLLWTWMFSA